MKMEAQVLVLSLDQVKRLTYKLTENSIGYVKNVLFDVTWQFTPAMKKFSFHSLLCIK